jgi:hypothetical protein
MLKGLAADKVIAKPRSMNNRRNYYRILHVQPDAPAEVIRTSYRTLMRRLKMHPDLGGDHWNATVINEAFETLSDPEKRAVYDKDLKALREWQKLQGQESALKLVHSRPKSESEGPYRKCHFCGARYEAHIADLPEATCQKCDSPLFPAARNARWTTMRRALERVSRRMPVTCTEAGRPDTHIEMITEDISLSGTRLTSPHKLSLGQVLKIEYAFGKAIGVVTRVEVDSSRWSTRWCAGVRFLTLKLNDERGVFLSVEG